MNDDLRAIPEDGFTLLEMMIALLILLPLIGSVVNLFSVAVNQHSSEQSSVEANQDARSALEMMTQEIAQAGSHGDRSTTTTSQIIASTVAQPIPVVSSSGLTAGDFVDLDVGANNEIIKVTAVGTNSISGVVRRDHLTSGAPVRLFALPYLTGVIPPAGMAANSSATVTTLQCFGDMNSDGTVQYIEYKYDAANNQITRSITPITQGTLNPALSLVRNVKSNSVQFTLNTSNLKVVTSVNVSFTVQNNWATASKLQETVLSSRIVIPSALAASALLNELQTYGGINRLPPTPTQITTWINQ